MADDDQQVPRIGDPESWAAWSQAVGRMFGAVGASLANIGAAASRSFGQSTGGQITGPPPSDDRVPYMLSRGHVALPRAAYDAVGIDAIARLNSRDGFPAHRPDVTIVEPDGSLTEVEGSGP